MIDWTPYIDKYGLVQPEADGRISDNGVRFSAEALLSSRFPEPGKLYNAIKACCNNGLLSRYPGCPSQDSFDNYISAVAASHMMDGGHMAEQIYLYGRKHWGFYCNDGFRWNAFLWRNPSLVSFMRFCANDEIGWVDQKVIAESLKIAADTEDQDAKILSWMMVHRMRGRYTIVDSAIDYWVKKFMEQYRLGLGEVLGNYYSVAKFTHPNSLALIGRYI